jgi:transposase
MEGPVEVIFRRCAGLDVHKKTVTVCVRILDEAGQLQKQTRTFGTTTGELEMMATWFVALEITHVAMESTGVFWKPIYNILEGRFELLLCNAQHVKRVPGRKTDVKDCEWLAQLLQHGLLRASFVPERPLRDLRDLTRHRAQLIGEQTRAANRIHKVLEDANIKLGAVASDILGVSGRAILNAIVGGENDPKRLAGMAVGQLRKKIPDLEKALRGNLTEHHRFMLSTLLGQVDYLESLIAKLSQRIAELTPTLPSEGDVLPFDEAVRLAMTIPGFAETGAQNVLAEIGTDMTRFPTAAHLASWSGICPGNHESAGKQRSGRTRKGSRWLRRALVQAAWAASRTKDTYLSVQFWRLSRRRGRKRALVAVAHSLLVILYYMLKRRQPYGDLGPMHFDELHPERLTRNLVRRLEALGHKVTLEKVA